MGWFPPGKPEDKKIMSNENPVEEKKKQEALKQFFEAIGSSGTKTTASEVMKGLTGQFQVEMISNIPIPEAVVNARMVKTVLGALGYPLEAQLVGDLATDYMKTHVSKSGKNNRAKNIIEAFASIFRAELEIEKSKKGMFTK